MTAYFIRRLLLVPITFFGITLMIYVILRLAPGNPVERELADAQAVATEGSGRGGGLEGGPAVSPVQVAELRERYQTDKNMWVGYLGWLGLWPREMERTSASFGTGEVRVEVPVWGTARMAEVTREGTEVASARFQDSGESILGDFAVRIESPEDLGEGWRRTIAGKDTPTPADTPYRVVVYRPQFAGVLQGELGRSTVYNIPVSRMFARTLPISLLFGVSSIILVYAICIPLGVAKALKHGSWFDSASSAVVFAGYAVPGYALGALLVVWLGARMGWFPISGITSADFATMSWSEQLLDVAHHAVLPLLCYVIGSFAMMTMLVKNSLMDQLGSDYVRTAVAKGVSYRRAVVGHALRNSLIPVATHLGGILTVFVSGNFLIERIFDINGFGLLTFQALQDRDYFVIMGATVISSLLVLLGNILSDFAVAVVDPRVSYE